MMEGERLIPFNLDADVWSDVSIDGSHQRVIEFWMNKRGTFEDAVKMFGVPEEEHETILRRMEQMHE